MKRKVKITLIVLGIFVILGGAFGGYLLWRIAPASLTQERVEISLPFETINTIDWIEAFGELGYQNHNGIDFGINISTEIIACSKMRVVMIDTRLNEGNGLWQTNIGFKFSWKYYIEYIFESFAQNETYGDIQREVINVKIGQVLEQGDVIGELLLHTEDSLLHVSVKESGEFLCPYLFFDSISKVTFDTLLASVGSHPDPCN